MKWTAQDWSILLGSIGAVIGALLAGIAKIMGAIHEVHLSINSRMDELVAETRKASLAEGRDQMRAAGDPVLAPPLEGTTHPERGEE